MPIDLIGAVVAWLVAASADAGIRLIRGSHDERMLRKALAVAVNTVVKEADPALQKPLRAGLALCFSSPLAMSLDGSTPTGDWLRSAIAAQVSQLEGWVNNDTGRRFFEDAPVDPAWLTERVTDAIIGALRQVVASGSLPELVRGVDTTDVLARLDALGLLVAMTVVTGLVVPCSWQKIPKGGPMTVAGDSPDVIGGGPEPDEARPTDGRPAAKEVSPSAASLLPAATAARRTDHLRAADPPRGQAVSRSWSAGLLPFGDSWLGDVRHSR